MSNPTRRDICVALTAFAAMGTVAAEGQSSASSSAGPRLLHSEIFPFDKLPVQASPNGGASRAVLHGTLATGEFVESHETTLPAGQMSHAPHRHTHSEFLLIRDGRLEVMSDGQSGIVEAGAVVFTASGVLHSLKNVGTVPATYFVVAVGQQTMLP
jgi:mannose-6-phosphate isomerase-like protein (cupin superfamily)